MANFACCFNKFVPLKDDFKTFGKIALFSIRKKDSTHFDQKKIFKFKKSRKTNIKYYGLTSFYKSTIFEIEDSSQFDSRCIYI